MLWDVSPRFRGLSPGTGLVAHVLLTRAPVATSVLLHRAAPRLACVRPAASVHPEPGSNSPLYKIYKCFVRVLTIRLSFKRKLTDKYYNFSLKI